MQRLLVWLGGSVAAFGLAGVGVTAHLRSFDYVDRAEQLIGSGPTADCAPVSGVVGPEDLQIDPVTRLAFISSLDRRQGSAAPARGAIHAVSIDDPLAESAWRDRTGGVPERFEPLGLHFYEGAGVRRLFVVNAATNSIELFDVDTEGDLTHVETLSERRLTSPNDVVAYGPRFFYVTNDAEPGRNSNLGALQFLTRAGTGKVVDFDGRIWRTAADGLRFANGVALNEDGTRLYVAETSAATIRAFARGIESGALSELGAIPVPGGVDNINLDDDGALWIGAHLKPLVLRAHVRDARVKAPSAAFRVDPRDGSGAPVTVYADDGTAISGASAAARLDDILLVGALAENKFMLCRITG